jgi:hypothetical protein
MSFVFSIYISEKQEMKDSLRKFKDNFMKVE